MSGFIACGHNPLDDPFDRDDEPYDSRFLENEKWYEEQEEIDRQEREFRDWNPGDQ